jgi:opacity protein-like surface antigen
MRTSANEELLRAGFLSTFDQECGGNMQSEKEYVVTWPVRSVRHFAIGLVALLLILLPLFSLAQSEHPFTVNVGAGVTPLTGGVSHRLDNGWHIDAGGGINITRYLAASVNYTYYGLGVGQRLLNEAQVPDGNAHIWSVTANPRIRLSHSSKVDPYLVGGVGYYRRTVEFTRPTAVEVLLFDPFFGVFFNTIVRADQVIGRIRQGGVGGSLGAGFDIKLGDSGLKLYTEARYHYADTGRVPTRMVPVTFGLRW